VSWPDPRPGMVIRYGYLWLDEHEQGLEECKDRPAAVVVVLDDDQRHPLVTVVPITHTSPADAASAIEIPASTKRRLGLDDDRSWIVLSEANDFRWPGPDLRPLPGRDASTVVYGMLPPALFRIVRQRMVARVRAGKLARVARTE
jgi:mRNA-degrading endonuclease toxin of MazEF toxin-antitoxin module